MCSSVQVCLSWSQIYNLLDSKPCICLWMCCTLSLFGYGKGAKFIYMPLLCQYVALAISVFMNGICLVKLRYDNCEYNTMPCFCHQTCHSVMPYLLYFNWLIFAVLLFCIFVLLVIPSVFLKNLLICIWNLLLFALYLFYGWLCLQNTGIDFVIYSGTVITVPLLFTLSQYIIVLSLALWYWQTVTIMQHVLLWY